MMQNFDKILNQFLKNSDISKISIDDIQDYYINNPLNFLGAFFLLLKDRNNMNREINISLYFHNSLWVTHLFEKLQFSEGEKLSVKLKNTLDSSHDTEPQLNTYPSFDSKDTMNKDNVVSPELVSDHDNYVALEDTKMNISEDYRKISVNLPEDKDSMSDVEGSKNFFSWLNYYSNIHISANAGAFDGTVATISMAKIYESQNQYEKAINIYKEIMDKDPNQKEILSQTIKKLTNKL